MKVYLKSRKDDFDAQGEFDVTTQELVVLKGSRVSKTISSSPTFRGSTTIKKLRDLHVKDEIVLENVAFKSSSTAANFVTGSSTNGLRTWKTADGISLKDLIE